LSWYEACRADLDQLRPAGEHQMDSVFAVDWVQLFKPDTPPLEMIVRGSIVYLSLFSLLRFVLRREAGTIAMSDLLVIVLIADAAQNAMAGSYNSIPDGLLLVATIVFWSFALDWLAYHVPWMARFLHPPPLPLVRDGRLLRRNMRRELITEDELMSQLRQQGVENLESVQRASMEGDGRISVIKRNGEHRTGSGVSV
jgi:uncharacterized membrane protein YcaP (DUF421 family)